MGKLTDGDAHQNRTTPPYHLFELHLVLQRQLPPVDPGQLLAPDGLRLRCPRFHACHLLEAQELPGQPTLPHWIYTFGSLLRQRGDFTL